MTYESRFLRGWLAATLALAQVSAAETTLGLDGSTSAGPLAQAFAEYFVQQHPEVKLSVSEFGSGNGAKRLIRRWRTRRNTLAATARGASA